MNTGHTAETASEQLRADLVLANRILANEGILDGFGHVSVRHDKDPGLFLISRSMAPGLVSGEDLLACDLHGRVIDAAARKTYVERFIHSAIYLARPDVRSVVHTHSPAVVPFSVSSTRLRPICHMSGFLGSQTPVFEIRHTVGDASDLLIRSEELGQALATVLGQSACALMRGHGNVVVGSSLKQAVFRAFYTDLNARQQAQALTLGDVTYLSDEESVLTAEANDQHLDRPWQLWQTKLQDHR